MLTHSNGKGSGSGMNDGILCYSHPERRLRTERESVEEWTTILELSHFGRNYWRSSFSIGPACAPRPGMSAFRVGLAPPWERQTCQLTWLARPGASGIRC